MERVNSIIFPIIEVLGVPVSIVGVDELHSFLLMRIREKSHVLVLNVNVFALNLAYKTEWLRQFLRQAEIVFCDGAGVQLAAWMLGGSIPVRITYADWTWQLAEFAEKNGLSLFLLGAQPGVAQQAADRLLERHPKLNILGIRDGYFDKTTGSHENQMVVQQINDCHPDILIVGFGMPLQEQWLMENWPNLNVGIGLTGGAVFDYISGSLKRAPRWMTERGLEWLGRLLIEPGRLWKRYLVGNPIFLWRVFKQRVGWETKE
jgi:N-acetylglucosaminyldiphosphoundecaprenol N-acetyl-beta-D-mannosaminyltransferase